MKYKKLHDLNTRINNSNRLLKKYPDRIPIICECGDKTLNDIGKGKFLVPKDLSVADMMYVIRKRIKITKEKSIYLFINNSLVPNSKLISQVYSDHHDIDGFLYITYYAENAFG